MRIGLIGLVLVVLVIAAIVQNVALGGFGGLLILLQLVCTYLSVRLPWFRRLIKAQPTLVFFKGGFLADAMRQQRITEQDILAALRQQNSVDPYSVRGTDWKSRVVGGETDRRTGR